MTGVHNGIGQRGNHPDAILPSRNTNTPASDVTRWSSKTPVTSLPDTLEKTS